jgi:predicted NBD/HSP70 family sugar kinase
MPDSAHSIAPAGLTAPRLVPPLDPGFMSPALWSRAMTAQCQATPGSRPLTLALERPDGTVSVYPTHVLPDRQEYAALNLRHIERLVKFLLWQRGGSRVLISGAPEIAAAVSAQYRPEGRRAFDAWFMGDKVYGTPLVIESRAAADMPEARENAMPLGRHLDGCRIGFDLGGSDRKCAAVIDGTVVFSEEIPWDPYFQSDPQYHYDGIMDSLKRAAAHLPRVDAIGGSAAGVYVNNEVRVASLFRGVSASDFEQRIRRIFFDLQKAWGGVPFEVVNDGEVTALAGSMAMNENRVLGISLGTSMAAGYVDAAGSIRPWLNELAFAPADFREDGPIDEWSGDAGCGVQFFSQQAGARLAPLAGLSFPPEMKFAERLIEVQTLMAQGDDRARRLYETVGVCFGHAIAYYTGFYDVAHILILGRVTSGAGGDLIISKAREVLDLDFPDLAHRLSLSTPDETQKRHGQAVAAASLPPLIPND